jgi:predicted negative regulator of RcsB-dependent stress response
MDYRNKSRQEGFKKHAPLRRKDESMKDETKAKLKFGGWGVVVGAVIAMIIGFSWGGWTTSSTADQMSGDAVLANEAVICVAQFIKDPDSKKKIEEFEALDDHYKQSQFVEQGGWSKMPGQKEASSEVTRACVAGIRTYIQK